MANGGVWMGTSMTLSPSNALRSAWGLTTALCWPFMAARCSAVVPWLQGMLLS